MKTSTADIITALKTKEVYLQFPQIGRGRYPIRKIEPSKCKVGCPIDTDVKAYLGLISVGKFEKALEVVKRDNPFPGICGRVCVHPCETECRRNEVDQALAICALKRFLADYELNKGRIKNEPIKSSRREKIAVIGSGPAGLTAAHDLVRLGYRVTVFEELPVAGGMLYTGIPEYRLPREIIKTEIDAIRELGVKIELNTRIRDLNKLQRQGYGAIFIAVGAHKGLKLRIPGEDEFEGFLDCITFLRAVNLTGKAKIGKKVVVIGGGNAAIDSARTALRLGSNVHIVYRRSRREMPANAWEVEEAEREGVKMHYLASPVQIIGEDGKVVGMKCIRNRLGPPDSSGRRRPVSIKGSEFQIEADTIIPAISQEPDLSWLPKVHGLKISKWNSFLVDQETLATNLPGIFAGGDCVTGPRTVIEAIAAGHLAARSIDRYLQGKPLRDEAKPRERVEFEIPTQPKGKKERAQMRKLSLQKRRSFKEVELGIAKKRAVEESTRCLRCGLCFECAECTPNCDKRLVALTIPGEASGLLLRVPVDYAQFPLSNEPLQGELSWAKGEGYPVIVEPVIAKVRDDLCRGCGDCVEICDYSAPQLYEQENGVKISIIDQALCKGCGVCATICPSSAITMGHYSDGRINRFVEQSLTKKGIVCFVCNWVYNLIEDVEEVAGLRVIRVICSGRISPALILRAFENGAEGVIGIGCPQGECHYISGNETAEQNFQRAKSILRTLGISAERVKFERLSSDEPERFDEIISSFAEAIKKAR